MKGSLNKSQFKEVSNRWRQFNWKVHLLIGMVGLVVIGSVSYGFIRSSQLYEKYVPLIDASMEMRLEATTAYLWFEEMLAGDKSKALDDILTHLDRADWYSKAMIEGGESGHVKLLYDKDSPFRERILNLQIQLTTQRTLLNKRLVALSNAGPGSDIDKIYHETLEAFIDNATQLEMEIKAIMKNDYRIFRQISFAVIGICSVLFIITGYAFYHYENLRRKSYADNLRMERLLVQSEKMAALGTMISSLAHEMNNPNNFISFNIPILKDYLKEMLPIVDHHARGNHELEICDMPYPDFRTDLTKLIATIENGSFRINRIVSDLKEFSRKKDQVKKEWVDLNQVIDKAVTFCETQLHQSIDHFDVNRSNIPEKIFMDPKAVKMILVNLLINAAEAADKTPSRIELNIRADHRVSLEVKDNGSGIRPEDIDRVFDPFFSTRSPHGSGGMGLYLSRTLADQMDAIIEVESLFGEGSTFRLVLENSDVATSPR